MADKIYYILPHSKRPKYEIRILGINRLIFSLCATL